MRKLLTVLIICLSAILASAQLRFIPLSVDYATFDGKAGKTYTEVYVAFYQSDLTYAVEDSEFVAHFRHTINVLHGDSVVYDYSRSYVNHKPDDSKINAMSQFMDVFGLELEPGNYTLQVGLSDDTSQKSGSYTMDLKIPGYDSELELSSLQLSTKIEKAANPGPFSTKNNLKILPNPSATYSPLSPILYFYFEGYNLKPNKDKVCDYTYHYYISDKDGRRFKDFPEKKKSATSATIAEASGINVISLPGNDYFLNIELTDNTSGESAFARKKLVLNKPKREGSDAISEAKIQGFAEYVNYTKGQLKDEFEKVRYISTPEEKKVFAQLDLIGMKRFMGSFWKRRDINPSTPVNEYKQAYFENLRLANDKYGTNFKEGWRTDRGRVVLIYGQPDEIERHPSALNTQPYEIWYYYSLDGGSEFVFGDVTGHGNFELLHSTFRNEIKDPDWVLRIGQVRTRDQNRDVDRF